MQTPTETTLHVLYEDNVACSICCYLLMATEADPESLRVGDLCCKSNVT